MEAQIDSIQREVAEALRISRSSKEIEALKVKYLGKKGSIQSLMQALKECSVDQRPQLGRLINDLKESVTQQLDRALELCEEEELKRQLATETIDITFPGELGF